MQFHYPNACTSPRKMVYLRLVSVFETCSFRSTRTCWRMKKNIYIYILSHCCEKFIVLALSCAETRWCNDYLIILAWVFNKLNFIQARWCFLLDTFGIIIGRWWAVGDLVERTLPGNRFVRSKINEHTLSKLNFPYARYIYSFDQMQILRSSSWWRNKRWINFVGIN